ncbi:MAG: PLP-dependent aminotransferase family protein [Ilumatobacter sp.]
MDSETSPSIAARIAADATPVSAWSIATTIGAMVGSGELRHGDRLPTVRSLASELGVSSSTVADGWKVLSRHGLIETARRNGTVIRAARSEMTGRFWRVPATAGSSILDLSTGTPDTDLLPTMSAVLSGLRADIAITSYVDRPVLAPLEELLRARWPFEPDAMTVLDGCLDALDRLVSVVVGFGDTVLVEDPTFPPILDMLEQLGARVIGVELDDEGPSVPALRLALAEQPVLAVFQPAAHNPTGRSMSAERVGEVAAAFAELAPETFIVEDHHAGDLVRHAPTLGAHLPAKVVRVHSFSKSHGPDLRIAAVGGAREPIEAVVDRRRLGPSWTSRLIQTILLTLLQDAHVDQLVDDAAIEYARRRRAISDGLARAGIEMHDGSALNLWIPVPNEQRAVLALALDGIGVAPGAPFWVDQGRSGDHLRISVGNARDDLDRIVAAITTAASS